jgi:hypothetical protein
MQFVLIISITSCAQGGSKTKRFLPSRQPVFQLDYNFPTADKPQSKLWFDGDYWWALLPRSTGPSLWQRTEEGWKEHPEVAEKLKGIPGRADVWGEKNQITAVGVGDSSLTVFRLNKGEKSPDVSWEPEILARLYPPSPGTIETATLARDGNNNWWVSATANSKVCVWHSTDEGKQWASPFILAEGIDEDDICSVTPLADGIGVVWSDQVRDAILIRIHKNEDPREAWGEEEIVDMGNNTADDHINTSLSPDNTLWIATKNSVDTPGKPQFVMRVRSAAGEWINNGYCVLQNNMKRPSRPIVITTESNKAVFTGYGDNDRSVPNPHNAKIVFSFVDSGLNVSEPLDVIYPLPELVSFVQNVTGPKFPFPAEAPWIILASDPSGRVYEANLKNLFEYYDNEEKNK